MATNDFKPFATGSGANVMSQADYLALSALLTGFQSGKASSAQVNKAIRQATTIAALVGQFIANANVDALDNGDVDGLVTKFTNALTSNLGLKTAAKRDVGTGANQIPDMSSFASSKTTNGWQKLPGGLIIQWGQTASVASEQNVSVTFPIAFPTNYILAYATYANTTGDPASPGATYVGQIRTSGNTSIFIRNLGPAIAQYNWLAIGY